MKHLKFLVLSIIYSFLLVSCSNRVSADLSNINVGGLQLGTEFEKDDFDKYTLSERFPKKENTVDFEEMSVTVDANNNITKIHATIFNTNIILNINSYNSFKTIEDVINIIGDNYKESWNDREQGLRQIIYNDYDNLIKVAFVYDDYDKRLVWVIIE